MKKEQGKEKRKMREGTGKSDSDSRDSHQATEPTNLGRNHSKELINQRVGSVGASDNGLGPTAQHVLALSGPLSGAPSGWQRFCRPLCRNTAPPCKPAPLATGCINRRLSHTGLRQRVSGLLPERRASRRAIDLKLEDGHLGLECFGAWKLSMFTMYPLNILGHSVFILFLSFTVL